jgi:alpha-beta hydrolase superfamily lysophospholipase
MTAQEFQWTTAGHVNIFALDWPVAEPKAVVCIVHGLGEHINRYHHVAAFFNQRQIAVLGNDRQGHGRSGGKRGHATTFEAYLEEISYLLVEAEVRYPGAPVFLYGQSMGGNLVLYYTLRRHPHIAGVISSAPWIRLSFKPSPVKVFLGKIMKAIYPAYSQHSGLKAEHLSKDSQVVEAYKKDPLVHFFITSETGIGLLQTAHWLDHYSGEMPVPTLIMHGGDDQITSPDAAAEFAERVTGNIAFKRWEGLYHEIHNESVQKEVLQFAADWIMDKLKTA